MTSTSLTSELEAINTILEVAEEAPVQSLNVSGLQPLQRARAALDEASRLVQTAGWVFNTEYDYPLTRADDNTITVGSNMLKVDVNDEYCMRPVQRGLRIYDADAHTYEFDRDLKAAVVLLLPWDELPQPARHYIMVRAARSFQSRQVGSDLADKFTENDEALALAALQSHESDVGDHNVLRDNWSSAGIILGRDSPFLST